MVTVRDAHKNVSEKACRQMLNRLFKVQLDKAQIGAAAFKYKICERLPEIQLSKCRMHIVWILN